MLSSDTEKAEGCLQRLESDAANMDWVEEQKGDVVEGMRARNMLDAGPAVHVRAVVHKSNYERTRYDCNILCLQCVFVHVLFLSHMSSEGTCCVLVVGVIQVNSLAA